MPISHQPIRHKDPEQFKSVVTGVIPLDENDEGFSSIRLNVNMDEIYKHFKILINDYEVEAVKQLRLLMVANERKSYPKPVG